MMKIFHPHQHVGAASPPRPGRSIATGTLLLQKDALTRRAFIRAALLTGTAVLAWLLLRRSCAGNGGCGGCGQYAGCALPWKVRQH